MRNASSKATEDSRIDYCDLYILDGFKPKRISRDHSETERVQQIETIRKDLEHTPGKRSTPTPACEEYRFKHTRSEIFPSLSGSPPVSRKTLCTAAATTTLVAKHRGQEAGNLYQPILRKARRHSTSIATKYMHGLTSRMRLTPSRGASG